MSPAPTPSRICSSQEMRLRRAARSHFHSTQVTVRATQAVHHVVHSYMHQPWRSLMNANPRFRYRTDTLRVSQINNSNPKPSIHSSRQDHLVYAPSLPNSFVQSAFFVRSSPLTVGLLPLIAFTKSRTLSGGSRSSSPSRSVQDFSTACESPGEHGVHFCTPSTCTCLNRKHHCGYGWLCKAGLTGL